MPFQPKLHTLIFGWDWEQNINLTTSDPIIHYKKSLHMCYLLMFATISSGDRPQFWTRNQVGNSPHFYQTYTKYKCLKQFTILIFISKLIWQLENLKIECRKSISHIGPNAAYLYLYFREFVGHGAIAQKNAGYFSIGLRNGFGFCYTLHTGNFFY